jgi:hypothetical protein
VLLDSRQVCILVVINRAGAAAWVTQSSLSEEERELLVWSILVGGRPCGDPFFPVVDMVEMHQKL